MGLGFENKFHLGSGIFAEYVNGDLQLRNGCADLGLCSGAGLRRCLGAVMLSQFLKKEKWEIDNSALYAFQTTEQ